ncbi:acyltransferase [Atlantibacter subterranea]|uniref:acyltransferase family protein n=1 Tax=Atlantibacter subterraneus TaxID=255519 RepID=UPI0020C3AA69|nr:acyltransferase [Atlantibacter subterranea]UTJ49373.1 acyltransferase [Atlantibacter subterranea]
MNNKRILFLDYLRVLAFITVIIGHKYGVMLSQLRYDETLHITLRQASEIIYSLCVSGALGVIVFFMISGFIITHVLRNEGATEFFIKRIFRIYPLYIFALLCETGYLFYYKNEAPDFKTLILQSLLIGDFLNIPTSLKNVEWTLRVEMLFYLFMGILKILNLTRYGNLLAIILLLVTTLLWKSNPFPGSPSDHIGYVSAFSPFLFIGVIFYLIYSKMVNKTLGLLSIVFMFYVHLDCVSQYILKLNNLSYGIYGVAIFTLSYLLKQKFPYNKQIIVLSEITYPIYLFHNWAWDPIKEIVIRVKVPLIPSDLQIIIILLAFCYFVNNLIEKRANQFGRHVAHKLTRKKGLLPPSNAIKR